MEGKKSDDTKSVQAVVRPGRLGLGATAKPWERRKNGDSKNEITSEQARIVEGAHVGVIKGPYEGDLGIVSDVVGSSFVVQLEHFGDKTQPKSFLLHIDSTDTFREFTKAHPPPKGKKKKKEKDRSSGEDNDDDVDKETKSKRGGCGEEEEEEEET